MNAPAIVRGCPIMNGKYVAFTVKFVSVTYIYDTDEITEIRVLGFEWQRGEHRKGGWVLA